MSHRRLKLVTQIGLLIMRPTSETFDSKYTIPIPKEITNFYIVLFNTRYQIFRGLFLPGDFVKKIIKSLKITRHNLK